MMFAELFFDVSKIAFHAVNNSRQNQVTRHIT